MSVHGRQDSLTDYMYKRIAKSNDNPEGWGNQFYLADRCDYIKKIHDLNIISIISTSAFIGLGYFSFLIYSKISYAALSVLSYKILRIAVPLILISMTSSFLSCCLSGFLINKKIDKEAFISDCHRITLLSFNFIAMVAATVIGSILGGIIGAGLYYIPNKNIYFKISAISIPILMSVSLSNFLGNELFKYFLEFEALKNR